jgi:acetyltransferase-like isoleucine patch superfamily enzyme
MPQLLIDEDLRGFLFRHWVGGGRHGRFWICDETRIEPPFTFHAEIGHDHPLQLGAFSYTNSAFYGRPVSVGRYCSIGSGLHFGQVEHATTWLTTSNLTYDSWAFFEYARDRSIAERRLAPLPHRRPEVTIGNDVWVGQNVYIKSGITVGDGAVIGAHAVVTKDVPPYAIVAGNPARLIRLRFAEALVERLLRVRWWRFEWRDLHTIDFTNVAQALDVIEAQESDGVLTPYTPEPYRLGTLLEQYEQLRTINHPGMTSLQDTLPENPNQAL